MLAWGVMVGRAHALTDKRTRLATTTIIAAAWPATVEKRGRAKANTSTRALGGRSRAARRMRPSPLSASTHAAVVPVRTAATRAGPMRTASAPNASTTRTRTSAGCGAARARRRAGNAGRPTASRAVNGRATSACGEREASREKRRKVSSRHPVVLYLLSIQSLCWVYHHLY